MGLMHKNPTGHFVSARAMFTTKTRFSMQLHLEQHSYTKKKEYVEGNTLIYVYSSFIILVALKEMFYKGSLDFNEIGLIIVVLLAGIFQGLFVSGGPLLIIYVSKKIKDADAHRGTLGLIWIFMNGSMMIQQIAGGQFTPANIMNILIGLPAVFLGVWIGGRLAQKLDRQKFLRIVYVLLIISALSMIL